MKTVIIQSIGNANPGVSKLLADAFGIDQKILAGMLYCAPAVFLKDADIALAQKAETLLTQLGLEVTVQDSTQPLPMKPEIVDIAVYINDPLKLMKVSGQLSDFIGITETEALRLLLNEPAVVLGGVSIATACTLQKRLDAEVIATNPKKDCYCIDVVSKQKSFLNNFNAVLNQVGVQYNTEVRLAENLDYEQARQIWTRFPNSEDFVIYNKSFQRHQIHLVDFDLRNEVSKHFLTLQVGMPADLLHTIHQNLPVILDESVSVNTSERKLKKYSEAGLICEAKVIPFGKYKITIMNIRDNEQVKQILKQFFEDVEIMEGTQKWTSPLPLNSILNRYLERQLELIGCEVENEYVKP